jgi:hypothetical protein
MLIPKINRFFIANYLSLAGQGKWGGTFLPGKKYPIRSRSNL